MTNTKPASLTVIVSQIQPILQGSSQKTESMVTPVFCNTDFDTVGLESIRRLNGILFRALMSSAPDEPQKIYGFNEPFRFTGSSTGRWLVSSISVLTRSVIL
ncbi:hypothetical protein EAO15_02895 [Klebsiella pneumoniae]|nr:hypothetical protein EAO15_02895 [Klebsiella pneumoniae]